MVMNHYKRPKSFYVRTRVWYTTEPRKSIIPIVIGNCAQLANGMSYDVAGGGRKGSNYVNSSDWVAPFSGRMLVASSHQHGGGKYQALDSRTCRRRLFKAPVYHGLPTHPYNAIRPILHEPGPIGSGAYATAKGIPISEGEVLRRTAVHDNHNLHVAAMGFWATWFVEDDSVKPCGKLPDDIVEINKPPRYDRTPDHDLVVPQLSKPKGVLGAFDGTALEIGDDFFRPGRITAKVGETVTWNFTGSRPHSVTVANGPRGFSSVYWGSRAGESYSVTPTVKGTYRLVCLVHPTTMAETLVVK
jgi:plastocyanin